MVEGVVSDKSVGCVHEIDKDALPDFDPSVGKIFRCVKCGERLYKPVYHRSMPGDRVRKSKKERRLDRSADRVLSD